MHTAWLSFDQSTPPVTDRGDPPASGTLIPAPPLLDPVGKHLEVRDITAGRSLTGALRRSSPVASRDVPDRQTPQKLPLALTSGKQRLAVIQRPRCYPTHP